MRAHSLMLFLVAFFALASVRMPVRAEAARAPEPISLQQLLARALSDPPRVLAARAALARADAERGMAQAGYFPSLTMQASEGISYDNRQQIPDAFVNQLVDLLNPIYDALDITVPANASDQAKTRLEALSQQVGGTAQLDWSLVNVARRKAIQATTQGRDAQQFAVSGAQRLALAAACDLYMRALASSQFVADAEITEERRRQQHEGIGGLVKAGLRPPVDETRARIEAVAAKYRLEVRRVEERAAFAALAVSVGRDPNRPLRPQPLAASPFSVPQTLEEATAAAFEYRPELKTLRVSLLGRQAELSAALWRRAPTLGISGTANASYIDQIKGEGYQGSQYSTAAQVYLRVQTFDASIWRSANVARANMLQAQRALEITTLDVKAEVADASFATERAHAELERATQVLAAAGAAREAQNGRYQTGVASLLELLDAEAVEQNARFDRIQAERDHQLANVRLLAATGLIRQLAR